MLVKSSIPLLERQWVHIMQFPSKILNASRNYLLKNQSKVIINFCNIY